MKRRLFFKRAAAGLAGAVLIPAKMPELIEAPTEVGMYTRKNGAWERSNVTLWVGSITPDRVQPGDIWVYTGPPLEEFING